MSKTKASMPPPPPPAAIGAAGAANLGMLRNTIPVTKQQALVRTRIVGYIYEFEYGFVWQPDDGGPQVFRWNLVGTVNWFASQNYVNGVYTGTQYWLTLASTDGQNLKFSGTCKDPAAKGGRNSDPLAPAYLLYQFLIRARETISAAQLPGAISALSRGEQLAFGDLRISATGIEAPKGFVPWESVKAVSIYQGRVSVRQEGKFFSLSSHAAEKIPNCPLFLTLAQLLTNHAAGRGPASGQAAANTAKSAGTGQNQQR
jgi:hypothetical protein